MLYNPTPGDVIPMADAVTLTVVAVEGDLIRLGREAPDSKQANTGHENGQLVPKRAWWEDN